MANEEPPKDQQDDKDYSSYVSPRLRSKMSGRDHEDEEKSGSGATIAVVGLIALILVCGALFLLSQKNSKKTTAGQTAEASPVPEQVAADSAAAADSIAALAAADSMARAQSQSVAAKTPPAAAGTGAKSGAPPASKSAATAQAPAAGTAAPPVAAAPAAPRKYGIAVGEFLFDDKAASEKDRLGTATSLTATVMPKTEGGTTTYQVVLGEFDSRAAAEAKGSELLASGAVKESRVIQLKKK
jgi:sporulation related protein